jgi:oligosaccharide repeat unit polymerase
MLINGWTLSDLLFDLLATSGRFAALRGNQGMEYGLVGILGVLFTYLPASLGGLIYAASNRGRVFRLFIIIIAMMPGVLAMVIQSSKLIFLIALCFFISGLFINNLHGLREIKINTKLIKISLKLFIVIFPLTLISFISREHYGDLDDLSKTTDVIFHALASYALGQTYAFSDFFSYYIGMDSASIYNQDYYRMGAYTFTSIAEIFGANVDFPPGLYLETGRYEDIFETNIFTFFRGAILDFGIIGSLILFSILGFFSHLSFTRTLIFKNKILSNLFYMHIVVFVFMTYLISVFMARYMYVNFVVLFIILFANSLHSRRSIFSA